MSKKPLKPLPHFANEDEEARWYFEHDDEFEDYFGPPLPRNPIPLLERLGLKHPATKPISIRLDPRHIAQAKQLAERHGVRYQTLLRRIIATGLEDLARESV